MNRKEGSNADEDLEALEGNWGRQGYRAKTVEKREAPHLHSRHSGICDAGYEGQKGQEATRCCWHPPSRLRGQKPASRVAEKTRTWGKPQGRKPKVLYGIFSRKLGRARCQETKRKTAAERTQSWAESVAGFQSSQNRDSSSRPAMWKDPGKPRPSAEAWELLSPWE